MNRVDNRNTAMDKIVRKSAWTLFVTALLFAALLILSADLISMGGKVETSRITDDDITVRIRRRDGALETYQGHNYPGLKYGDEVVLSIAPIGQERAIEHGTLIFSMYHCRIKVYVGDQPVYTQVGPPRTQQIGHRYYAVPLPAGYEKKTICIFARCDERETASASPSYQIVPDTRDMYAFTDNRIPTVVLMLTGLTLSLLLFTFMGVLWLSDIHDGLRARKRNRDADPRQNSTAQQPRQHSLFFISLLNFSVILWYMGFAGLLVPLISNEAFLANAEYCALFFLPIPLVGFLGQESVCRWQILVCRLLLVFFCIFFAVTTWLNFFVAGINYVNFMEFLRVIIFITLLLTMAILLPRFRLPHSIERRFAIRGFLLSAGIGVTEIIRFALSNRNGYQYQFLHKSLMPAAILVLFSTIVFYFGMQYSRESYERIEQESLKRLAYTDQLTGAPNRSACNRLFQKIRDEKITDFVVIFADINFLKRTNDTWGHEKGDELICTAAGLLQSRFGGKDFFGRWGGDEFIAVHFGTEEETKEQMRHVAEDLVRINREKKFDFSMSVSWGVAASTKETPLQPEDAILLADKKMYENKKRAHAERRT